MLTCIDKGFQKFIIQHDKCLSAWGIGGKKLSHIVTYNPCNLLPVMVHLICFISE